jgi:hypothetical protein
VAIETNVVVLSFEVILAYAIIPNSPIKTNGPMRTHVCDVKLNVEFDYIITNIF